ncbi:TPA: polysaccharide pyruvyl transferase family protein [Enterobacter hormaechei subsp. steigerwaltii]|nr:polysaccharide pyruvyl transferase family protein [Enterobacter hormaechei subsp. steigerwaltii]HED2280968.1 polysaccharide pyruvyl transferase family protein [Enterobacter hormaechei subsp. steigerwaltii]HED3383001.1 polysaccharide pyruvyl transferase family protein [Enterobacter hormaechei subsp. steigerwaltii]HED3420222.1 polysaccharide pyruvyl transferase family protein [Enterobacter hormaechei subsp. steigerwaltii]HED3566187.1 polysaccharide pyruvyl transferase family protein [Enterobac
MRIKNLLRDRVIKRLGLNKFFPIGEEKNNVVCYFDTSISSLNLGDQIINDSGRREIQKILEEKQMFISSTHNGISSKCISTANNCELRIVCGSNLLSPDILYRGCWNLSVLDAFRLRKLIFVAVGWERYSERESFLTKLFYRFIFERNYIHSVRDEYTKNKLLSIGISNVLNTGCITTWGLTKEHCMSIPREKSKKVVFTLTDYDRDVMNDIALIDILKDSYDEVYFWPQGHEDIEYFESLNRSGICLINPNLESYDEFLKNNECDFVGTRLHGGIRALQFKKRTLIVAIDNRAREKSKDVGFNIIERSDIANNLKSLIYSDIITDINLNEEAIRKWKRQFYSREIKR